MKRLQAKLQDREKRYEENKKKELDKKQAKVEEREKRAQQASERRKDKVASGSDPEMSGERVSVGGGENDDPNMKQKGKGSKSSLNPVKAPKGSKNSLAK